MYFYHYKINNSTAINHVISGNFSGPSEVAVSRGRVLEIFQVHFVSKKMRKLCAVEFNSTIISMERLRCEIKDYILVALDSGKVMILSHRNGKIFPLQEYNFARVNKVSSRFTPGKHLAADSSGKSFVISSVEETIMFYNLTVKNAPPLKVFNKRCIYFDLVAAGHSYETSIYASLQVQYAEVKCNVKLMESSRFVTPEPSYGCFSDFKTRNPRPPMILRFYEFYVASKKTSYYDIKLPNYANKLIFVPSKEKCQSNGVLVCAVNEIYFVEYKTFRRTQCNFPHRKNDKNVIIACSTTLIINNNVIVLLQSENGDLYSARIVTGDEHLEIKMSYIDTIPVASAMCITNVNFLVLGAESGDHNFYKINFDLEDEPMEIEKATNLFRARRIKKLKLEKLVSRLENLSPVLSCLSEHSCLICGRKSPISKPADHFCNIHLQLYFTCGKGSSSTLRTLRYGVKATKLYSKPLSEYTSLAYFPGLIWSLKGQTKIEGEVGTFIVMSFINHTKVLSVGKKIEVDAKAGFKCTTSTLNCAQVEKHSAIQVHPSGFRYVYLRKYKEWNGKCNCLGRKRKAINVKCAAINYNEVALALLCKEVIYVKVTEHSDGAIFSSETRGGFADKELNVNCMEFLPRDPEVVCFAACFKNVMHLYEIRSQKMVCVTTLDLLGIPSSIVVSLSNKCPGFFITVGFEDGSIQRAFLNEENNKLNNTFALKLGEKGVKLIELEINSRDAILVVSNHAWITFNYEFNLMPLCEKIDAAAGFSSSLYPSVNFVAVSKEINELVFLHVMNDSTLFSENIQQLQVPCRQMLLNTKHHFLIMSHTESGKFPSEDENVLSPRAMDQSKDISTQKGSHSDTTNVCEKKKVSLPTHYSEFRIFDPHNKSFVFKLSLPRNHLTSRTCLVEHTSNACGGYLYVAGKHAKFASRDEFINYIYTYKISDDGKSFSEINRQYHLCEEPAAICSFQGLILVGAKNKLHLYDAHHEWCIISSLEISYPISNIYVRGSFFVVLCRNERVIYGYYDKSKKELFELHEDRNLVKVTTICFLNDDIIAAADFMGNLKVVLLPINPSEKEKGEKFRKRVYDNCRILSKSYLLLQYPVGEAIISLQMTSLMRGSPELILYTTICGTVGVLVPFLNETADKIFPPLEYYLMKKIGNCLIDPRLLRNPALEYRYICWLIRNKDKTSQIIDGNLYDVFNKLPRNSQYKIAASLKMTIAEVSEKIAEMKSKIYAPCSEDPIFKRPHPCI